MPAHRVRGHFFEELAADDGDEPFAFPKKVSKVFAAIIFTVMDKFVGYPNVTIGQFPHYPVLESVASLAFVFDSWEKCVEDLLTMGIGSRPSANESSTLMLINIRRQEPGPPHLFELRE
jgi:hypothetical protein